MTDVQFIEHYLGIPYKGYMKEEDFVASLLPAARIRYQKKLGCGVTRSTGYKYFKDLKEEM